MINAKDWLKSRRNLLTAVKAEVRARVGSPSRRLASYARAIEADYRGPWRAVDHARVARAFARARVVLAADFHAYAQAQRAHVRLIRDLGDGRGVTLALECVAAAHDRTIARYLDGQITEAHFLRRIGWAKSWGFPWAHYRPYFELARDRGFRVVGLNTKVEDLAARDRWTAARLVALAEERPDDLVFAVIGEWHVASAHVPRRLRRRLPDRGRVVTVLQDVEPLYLRLSAGGRAVPELMAAPGDRFCQMVSPPWVKWQSYLMYLEHAFDRELDDDVGLDYSDHVASLVGVLERDLGVRTRVARLQVFCPDSRRTLDRAAPEFGPQQRRALRYHLEHDRSFFVPERDWLYLSRATINHASALAGQFVHAHLCRRTRSLFAPPGDFLAMIWVEAVGFFFSKWINPRRKAETLEGLRAALATRQPRDAGRRALLLALDQRLSEVVWTQTGRLRPLKFKARDPEAYFEAARLVGHMLGERLFQRVRARVMSLPRLMSYLKMKVEDEDFAGVYWRLVRELEGDRKI